MHRNKRPKIEEAEAVTTNSKFSNDVVSKVVEFKFEACKTVCVLEAEVRIDGVMHIPLLQCQETGYFRIIPGTTEIQVIANIVKEGETKTHRVTGNIIGGEGTGAGSGGQTIIRKINLGLGLDYEWDYDRGAKYKIGPECSPKFTTTPHHNKMKKSPEFFEKRLQDWLSCAGGMLHFYSKQYGSYDHSEYIHHLTDDDQIAEATEAAEKSVEEADYKLKLYTVLSAHRPNDNDSLVAPAAHTSPDWRSLKALVAKRLNKDKQWAKEAVKNYILFLELKRDFNDYKESILFTPSVLVDEIWHAHLSFTDRYQRDIMAFCGGTKLIEHNPVLGEAARKRYAITYHTLKTRRERDVDGDDLNPEFWPEPVQNTGLPASYENDTGGDSDDCVHVELPDAQCSCG